MNSGNAEFNAGFCRAVGVEDALYLADTVNSDINTVIVGEPQRGCCLLHCCGRVRPYYTVVCVCTALDTVGRVDAALVTGVGVDGA